jgi:hypothetical protein
MVILLLLLGGGSLVLAAVAAAAATDDYQRGSGHLHRHQVGKDEGTPPTLDAPTDLLVDLADAQAPPLLLVVGRSRPTFTFVAPGGSIANNSMTDFQIVVRDVSGAVQWDSGRVAASAGGAAPSEGVMCGATLMSGLSYSWTVQYWAGSLRSEPATSNFDIGLLSEADWGGAKWLGAGQKQFRLAPPVGALASLRRPGARLKLHVAAPGGAVVEVGGTVLGDPVGLSLWTSNDKTVQYFSYDLTRYALLDAGGNAQMDDVIVTVGGGFFSSSVRPAKATNGARPTACRILLLLDTGATRSGGAYNRVLLRSSVGDPAIHGRPGPVLADDPWKGSTINTSLTASDGWTSARLADEEELPQGQLVPVPTPAASKRGNIKPVRAAELPNRPGSVLFSFPFNLVGHASLAASAVSGSGWIRLEHCETWNHSAGGCIPFGTPPFEYPLPICGVSHDGAPDDYSSRAGCDTYLVDDASAQQRAFAPKFTWHGFQHVVVTPSPGVTFSGELQAISAHWTTSDLKTSSSITFAGPGAEILGSVDRIVVNSQISNLAAFMPTDCPTRCAQRIHVRSCRR